MQNFVHLHNYSDYSLRHSISTIDRMIERVKKIGQNAIAITDEGNLFAAIKFSQECKNNNIQAIIGCEVQVNVKDNDTTSKETDTVLLLTKNADGFENLKQISSIGYRDHFYYYPRINLSELEQYKRGLICILPQTRHRLASSLERGQIDPAKRLALMYKDIFTDFLFLEMQNHGLVLEGNLNALIHDLGAELSIPTVAGNACYYPEQEDAEAHKIYIENEKTNKLILFNNQFYIKSRAEMENNFSQYTSALDRTVEIAQECRYVIKEKESPELPNFTIPSEFENQDEYLRYLTLEGIRSRYSTVSEKIQKRVEYELDCIIRMGYSGYFLIVFDIIQFCKREYIPVGPGRGSVAGSIVAYALGLTTIDPLKYDLLFERFLNPERISMPDIDTDFCVNRRKEVINYIRKKYGEENCGQIVTFSSLQPKGAIRDVGRSLNIELSEIDTIAKLFREPRKDEDEDEDRVFVMEDYLQEEPRLKAYRKKHKQLFQITEKLQGVKRHVSMHAAGVVIGKDPLIHYSPLYKDPKTDKTGGVATQYSMYDLEKVGLVKMDILGLRNVTIVDGTEKMIQKDYPNFSLDKIPLDDAEIFEMLSKGRSEAVFQFESKGMQQSLRRVRPQQIEDLIALNALFRPGPIKFINEYADVKNGREEARYLHPDMEPILRETYGVIVYQEQVMHIAQKFAGFSLAEADVLRKAMGKKKLDVMKSKKSKFIQGMLAKGYDKTLANSIFDLLIPFSKYGFNKSHAAAYSDLAYRTAYLKRYFPLYYMVNILNADHNKKDDLTKSFQLCKELGLKVLAPDANKSEYHFVIENGSIRYGLSAIRDISDEIKQHIPNDRKKNGAYSSFFDMIERLPAKAGLKSLLAAGIASGMFDRFYNNRGLLLANIPNLMEEGKRRIEAKQSNQLLLFTNEDANLDMEYHLVEASLKAEDLLNNERDFTSTYLRYNPIDEHRYQWLENTTLDLSKYRNAFQRKQKHYFVAYTDEVIISTHFSKQNNNEKNKNTQGDYKPSKEEKNETKKLKVYSGVLHDYFGAIPFDYRVDDTGTDVEIPLRKAYGFVGDVVNFTLRVTDVMSVPELVAARKNDPHTFPPLHDGKHSQLQLTVNNTISNQSLKDIKQQMMQHFGKANVKVCIQENDKIVSTVAFPAGFTVDANSLKLIDYLNKHSDILKVDVFR